MRGGCRRPWRGSSRSRRRTRSREISCPREPRWRGQLICSLKAALRTSSRLPRQRPTAVVSLVPAFSGLGAPHWDRDAHALISGMSPATTRAHIARAAVDSVSHQICDVVDVIEERSGPLHLFRADGGATASALVVQTQADLLGRECK